MTNILTVAPLLRQTVGFDRFNDLFETMMKETSDQVEHYPPYNIEKLGEDDYRITMAVAGFKMDDLDIVMQDGKLAVSGRILKKPQDGDDDVQVLHRGIATRAFERTFRLADYIRVLGADLADGLLTIHLTREVPEEKKPQMIPINGGKPKALTGRKKK